MSKVSCEIIKDLLPLYYDEVCSDESKIMVSEHLDDCSSCQIELDKIKTDIKMPEETVEENRSDGNVLKGIADAWNRAKVKAFVKGLLGAAVLFTVIFLGYVGLFRWNLMSVPTDVVKITDVFELEDGGIAYHVKLMDGYDTNFQRYSMDKQGNLYFTPYRPIIKTKAKYKYGPANMYYTLYDLQKNALKEKYGSEIKALYFGTPKDNILIWQKGMDLPKTSKKVKVTRQGVNGWMLEDIGSPER